MKTIAFFNNKGGVGKTSLVYHLAWMFADKGIKTLAVDLDPQANLTSMFLNESRLEQLWPDGEHPETVYGAIRPILRGVGDIAVPHVERISDNLDLISGDLGLSRFEDSLSENWPKCLDGKPDAFRVTTAFYRIILQAAQGATVVLIDVGPNLGAINRSALISAEQVVIPLAPDLFSLQGLKNLGPSLRDWREGWKKRLSELPNDETIAVPSGEMRPAGYVVMQHGIRDSRPVKAYQRWLDRMPRVYRESVLGEEISSKIPSLEDDPFKLALLKHYRSLMPMAMESNKPIFFLKSADGAIGAHLEAVASCYKDFEALGAKIAANAGISFSKNKMIGEI
jgi:cellulose biosynthesis protein BcsQ